MISHFKYNTPVQKGVHHGIETATRHMSLEAGGGGGVVVSVSSTCGVTCQGDMYATPAYTASKHAVTALTRTFGVRQAALLQNT